jgi:hypothetical protein
MEILSQSDIESFQEETLMAYRADISPYDRLNIASQYALNNTQGTVSRLQDFYHLSREDIHGITARALDAFMPQKPGPKPDLLADLQSRITFLECRNEVLKKQVVELEHQLSQAVIVDSRRIEDFVLTALVTPPTHDGISDLLAVAYGEKYRLSAGKISQLNNHYGTIAGLILLDEKVSSRFVDALADEIFFSRTATLVVADFYSTAIGAIELSAKRDGECWHSVLSRFKNLAYVASDLAKGLRKGISSLPWQVIHQADMWHLFREVHRITRKLEATTSNLLAQEDLARQNLKEGKIYRPTLRKVEARVTTNLEWMETYYQAIEMLVEAFNPVVEDHLRLSTQDEAKEKMDKVITILQGLPDRRINKLIKQLKDRRDNCFVFLDLLQTHIQALPVEFTAPSSLSPQQVRSLVLEEILLTRQLYTSTDNSLLQASRQLWQKLHQKLLPILKNYKQLRRAIIGLIGSPVRASSLVEMINSLLRRLQQIKRHPSQEFLYLAALHHNMKTFGSGCKRHGRSPFQILGVDFGTDNWLELLRTYKLAV